MRDLLAFLGTRFAYGFLVGVIFWGLVLIALKLFRGKDDR